MTEFFIVPYPANRTVFVDGGPNGRTNRVQSVERGSHTFDLGVPVDYMPDAQYTFVGGTTREHPMVIAFVPLVAVTGAVAEVLGNGDAAAPVAGKPVRKKSTKKAGKKTVKKTGKKTRRRVKHR